MDQVSAAEGSCRRGFRPTNGQRSSWRAVRCLSRPVSHGIAHRRISRSLGSSGEGPASVNTQVPYTDTPASWPVVRWRRNLLGLWPPRNRPGRPWPKTREICASRDLSTCTHLFSGVLGYAPSIQLRSEVDRVQLGS